MENKYLQASLAKKDHIMNVDNGSKMFADFKSQSNGQNHNLIQIAMNTITYRSLPNIHSLDEIKNNHFNFRETTAFLKFKKCGEQLKNFFLNEMLNEMNSELNGENGILGISYSQAKRITSSSPSDLNCEI